MARSDKIPKINPNEVEDLIERFEKNKLEERDKQLITSLLRTLLSLVSLLQDRRTSILRLKQMIFGRKGEKRLREEGQKGGDGKGSESPGKDSHNDQGPEAPKNETMAQPEGSVAPIKRGHGRNPASAYVGAKKVHCRHRELSSGSDCPDPRCKGRVYPVRRPHHFLQFTGQPFITATHYEQDVMRCGNCEKEFEAPLPEGIKPQKYDETADAAIAINKYGMATPYYRTSGMQDLCGIPLSESVQWERCEAVAEALQPIYLQMRREAANGKVFYGDDTPVRIGQLIKENEGKAKGDRVGMHTTGIVVELRGGVRIALYDNSRRHAGENLEELYEKRSPGLEPPIQMGDASARNWCGKHKRVVCKCLSHARRKFFELRAIYPQACQYVLEQIGKIYRNEAAAKGFSDEGRLAYHQEHSGPVMEELRRWMEEQINEKKVEPNSSLGKAIVYFRTHAEGLTEYLRSSGAPVDNNAAEQILKPAVAIRKNSYQYKTVQGAAVGGVILSVIISCRLNQINVWTYLVSVLKRSAEVKENPKAFLPWNYQGEKPEALAA
jgi:transposase